MTTYMPKRLPARVITSIADTMNGHSARRRAVADRNAKMADYQTDPLRLAVRRARQAIHDIDAARANGKKQWDELNLPVDCPVTGRSLSVHPQRREALLAFMTSQGWSDDPLEALVPTMTADELAADMLEEADRRQKEALAEIAAIEAHGADAASEDDDEVEDDEVEPVPVKGRARS